MSAVLVSSIGRFCTAARADEIEHFFQTHPLPSSQRRISQALENMRANSAMLDAIAKSPLATAEYWN